MSKLKSVGGAVVSVLLAAEFRPFEIRLLRALAVAVAVALGVKVA